MTKITRTGPGPVFPPILPSKIGANNKGPRPFPPPCLGSLAKGYKLLKITLLVGLTHAPLHMCLLPDCTEPSINQQMRIGAYPYKQARTRHRTYRWVLSSSAYWYLQSTNNIARGQSHDSTATNIGTACHLVFAILHKPAWRTGTCS